MKRGHTDWEGAIPPGPAVSRRLNYQEETRMSDELKEAIYRGLMMILKQLAKELGRNPFKD